MMNLLPSPSPEEQIRRLELEIDLFNVYLQKHGSIPKESENTIIDSPSQPSLTSFTIQDKLQLATSVLDDINHERSQKQTAAEKLVNALKVSLEETEMRISDLQRDAFAFKRDVVVPTMSVCGGGGSVGSGYGPLGTTTFGSTIPADRVFRYFRSKLLSMDATVDRLRLELNHQRNKVERVDVQLKQKEKAGTSFHYIDFHQLQIENKNLGEKVDRKLKLLGIIKFSEETLRKKLLVLEGELERQKKAQNKVARAVTLRQKHLKRLEDEMFRIKADTNKGRLDEKDDASFVNDHVDDNDLMDMIQLQANLYDLRNATKVWERKVEIAELASRNKNTSIPRQSILKDNVFHN